MPRGRATFRERDVAAAIRAVERTGNKVSRVEIGPDGSLVLVLASAAAGEHDPNEWDEVLRKPNPWDEEVPADYWKPEKAT